MAGVKGRSGGARPNTGGARPNSGPKPKAPVKLEIPVPVTGSLAHKDPKVFLLALMNDLEADVKLRADAAKTLMMYEYAKPENTVKSDKQDAAKKAAAGKFSAAAPPKLVANNR